jgi:hypothetical protein
VDARLVANLDLGLDPAKLLQRRADRHALGLPAQIADVEVVEIVVTDSGLRIAVAEDVPHRLKERAGGQSAVGQSKTLDPAEDRLDDWVEANDPRAGAGGWLCWRDQRYRSWMCLTRVRAVPTRGREG